MRSLAREVVYKYLYSKLYNKDSDEKFFYGLMIESKLSKDDVDFAKKLLKTINDNMEEIKQDIEKYSKDYSYNRIFSTDKCALFIAMAEIKYIKDIPTAVSIDEAVKLCSKYSTDKSLAFVNGILAMYNNDINTKEEVIEKQDNV